MASANIKRISLTFQDVTRFWSKVQIQTEGCWEWTAGCLNTGYGAFWANNTNYVAPRAAYFIYYLVDPLSNFVCHTCDNRKCVNPLHLWLGNHLTNNRDRVRKGRNADFRGEKSSSHKLTNSDVLQIRSLYNKEKGIYASQLAKKFNVSRENVNAILRYQTWKHI